MISIMHQVKTPAMASFGASSLRGRLTWLVPVIETVFTGPVSSFAGKRTYATGDPAWSPSLC